MIDDYEKTMALVQEMHLYLPLPARATKALVRIMRDKDIKLPGNREVEIESVFYMGDEGGIGCGLKYSTTSEEVVVASITHLRIKNTHPLGKKIRAYQFERIKNLQRAEKVANQKSWLTNFSKRNS